jgi:protein phosphatase
MKWQAFGLSDVGRRRETNQDQLLVDPERGLYAVADGMGGHAAGEVASRLAIESLSASMTPTLEKGPADATEAARELGEAFQAGNRKICEEMLTRAEWRGMGTTIVAMLVLGDEAIIGHVGDSRAYLLRDGRLHRLTGDHSWVHEQVRLGMMTDEEAHKHPMRNIVTRALGNRNELQVDLAREKPRPGDTFLLCSDGLNSMLSDDEISAALVPHATDPERACHALVDAANQAGGDDNVTVVVLRVEPQEST